jgi:uncharacterized UBP type Zn finger protein
MSSKRKANQKKDNNQQKKAKEEKKCNHKVEMSEKVKDVLNSPTNWNCIRCNTTDMIFICLSNHF